MLTARLLSAFVVVAAAGALPIQMVKVKGGRKAFKYRITYPRTGLARIDDELAAWAKRGAGACAPSPSGAPPDDGPSLTTEEPHVVRNDDQMFVVSFDETVDSDWIHDTHERTSFNFLRPDGWRVFLPELFEPAALPKISQMAIAALEKDGGDELKMIETGAGPDWPNFESFVLGPKTLSLYFASERVGAYADGPQEIELPLAALASYLRKDPRAPAPSFDCGKARTSVEHALCGDVALARLDRALQESYVVKVRYSKPANREALRASQHAWLQKRDATCGATPAAEIVRCLDRSYRERLAVVTAIKI